MKTLDEARKALLAWVQEEGFSIEVTETKEEKSFHGYPHLHVTYKDGRDGKAYTALFFGDHVVLTRRAYYPTQVTIARLEVEQNKLYAFLKRGL